MLQIIDNVGILQNGSSTAVSGWGTTSMSLSLIACQPRMLEPSKPRPSSKTSSSSLSTGMVKCCQSPGKSMNRRSTAFTSFSRHSANTSFGVIIPSFLLGTEWYIGFLRYAHCVAATLARPTGILYNARPPSAKGMPHSRNGRPATPISHWRIWSCDAVAWVTFIVANGVAARSLRRMCLAFKQWMAIRVTSRARSQVRFPRLAI